MMRFLSTLKKGVFLLVLLLILPSCAQESKTTMLDVALTDGTHESGILLAVDYNWLVLDQGEHTDVSPIGLIDYGLVDTVTVKGNDYSQAAGGLGSVIGAIAGVITANKVAPSANPTTRGIIGGAVGFIAGGALGYFIAQNFGDSDIVLPHPTDSDYVWLRQRAVFPDSLPPDLKMTLDSVDEADSLNAGPK